MPATTTDTENTMTKSTARNIFSAAIRSHGFRNLRRDIFDDGDGGEVVEWSVDVIQPETGEVVGHAVMPEHYEEVEINWL